VCCQRKSFFNFRWERQPVLNSFFCSTPWHRKPIYGRKGFTLIEVLAALSILAFGLSYISTSFLKTISSRQYIKHRIEALSFIDEVVWNSQSVINQKNILGGYTLKKVRGKHPVFELELSLDRVPGYKQLYRVSAQVSWRESMAEKKFKSVVYLRKDQQG